MQAIILCGGLSTRLGDITKDTPKILLEIGNRTILDIQLELLKEAEVDQVTLASGHLHQVLYDQVGESRSGVQIQYAKEVHPKNGRNDSGHTNGGCSRLWRDCFQ